ncbi:alpha/beta fold hydrolase [Actinomycetospora sp. NBRC 106375]|uniref:alpha/beta fold hydrolase n=1 Tax=Actinomycetospora sp. NBRC 106375 TaxID=3032207 RepID=UPI0033242E43
MGPGTPLDPARYFVICPGQIGGGMSSSPSNTPAPFDRGQFPPVAIADDVVAQHRLVTEHFGIERLHAVLGWSMGAQQTYEWAVRHPDMVPRAAAFAGTARTPAHNQIFIDLHLELLPPTRPSPAASTPTPPTSGSAWPATRSRSRCSASPPRGTATSTGAGSASRRSTTSARASSAATSRRWTRTTWSRRRRSGGGPTSRRTGTARCTRRSGRSRGTSSSCRSAATSSSPSRTARSTPATCPTASCA